ncbi:MAG: acyl carrier protein [Planctomycetes bacterium]|nr:acyl carrier protein [Planctomycetota bacterium]
MPVPLTTPLPVLPADPAAIEGFIVWRLQRLRHGQTLAIDATTPFMRIGVDSLEAITLMGELEQSLGRPLEPDLLFEHPTPRALALMLAVHACRGAPP